MCALGDDCLENINYCFCKNIKETCKKLYAKLFSTVKAARLIWTCHETYTSKQEKLQWTISQRQRISWGGRNKNLDNQENEYLETLWHTGRRYGIDEFNKKVQRPSLLSRVKWLVHPYFLLLFMVFWNLEGKLKYLNLHNINFINFTNNEQGYESLLLLLSDAD